MIIQYIEKMICGWTCFIAMMFIIGNIVFTYLMDKHPTVTQYEESLDDTQKKIYKKIVNERKTLSIQGYALGIAMSIGFLLGRHFLIKNNKSLLASSLSGLCVTASITFIVQYFYYMLAPKSDWMLNHLVTEEQKNLWVKVYRTYSRNYHASMLIGLIGAGLLGYAVC